MSVIHSMMAGGDSIDDTNVLRAGATQRVLGHAVLAPSTLGTFLRSFTVGHVRQLDAVGRELLRRAWGGGRGPGDRPVAGGVGALPVVDNVTLPALATRFRAWALHQPALLAAAEELGARFGVVPNRPALLLSALSGGNQQKVILAKWLQMAPVLVLLDEPTQGVDVGARQTVFRAIREAAERGACILCASSDAEQLAEICDRVLVLARGRISAELVPPALGKQAIVEACYGMAA
jgi:ABC-type sugar transport system ATPase subunit